MANVNGDLIPERVGYVTDIEGNIEFFNEYVRRSPILSYDSQQNLQLADKSAFVFGGDLFDRGPGDIRLSRVLVDLKKKYPTRVFLLIGNRDSNKLRFAAELSDKEMERPINEVPAIGIVNCDISPEVYFHENGLEDSKTNRLKWILHKTMNSPNAFEFRRQELSILLGRENINDLEVTNSFIESVQPPHGFVFEYLENAQLAVAIGDTLFIHGGIDEKACLFVPDVKKLSYFDRNTGDPVIDESDDIPGYYMNHTTSVHEWIDKLNEFVVDSIQDYCSAPFWTEEGQRGGEALMAYQCERATQGRTVVFISAFSSGNVAPISEEAQSYLISNGIQRVVVGHRPVGDSPLIVRQGAQIERVFADLSYSNPQAEDFRGGAVTELIIDFQNSGPTSSLHIHGILKDGHEYDFDVAPMNVSRSENSNGEGEEGKETDCIGYQTKDGFWIKVKMPDGKFRVAKTVGFNVTYELRDAGEL